MRIIVVLLVYFFVTLAHADTKISNLVEPAKYFVDHAAELDDLGNRLSIYKKVGLVGISGIGKTQLARMYTYKNQDKYSVVWFFDCNLDLSIQFAQLAKEINHKLCKKKSARIAESIKEARKAVIDYLTPKKDWVLVFDNLKINENDKISDIINWENNGNIILCSQDAKDLPQSMKLPYLKKSDAMNLVKTILSTKDIKVIEELTDTFKGYPLIVAQGSMFLNENKHMTIGEYKGILNKSNDKIKSHIQVVLKELTPKARNILYKIAVINNNKFSKNFLKDLVVDENFIEDLQSILRFGLISIIINEEEQQIFEMHDGVKKAVLEIAGDKVISGVIEEAIDRIDLLLPKTRSDKHLVLTKDNTLLANMEELVTNAQLYDINILKILKLRKTLISFYLDQVDYVNCEKMIEWLDSKDNKLPISFMTDQDKANYSEYLLLTAVYEYFIKLARQEAYQRLAKADKIMTPIKGFPELKLMINFQLGQYYVYEGFLDEAQIVIDRAEQIVKDNPSSNLDSSIISYVRAKKLLNQGSYNGALEQISILMKATSYLPLDTYSAPSYIMNANILNYMGNFQEAYKISKKVYEQEKHLIKGNHEIHALALVQLSRAELGLGKTQIALEHAEQAKNILISDKSRHNNNLAVSEDTELADAFVACGNALASLDLKEEAAKSYTVADDIYYNRYRSNISKIDGLSCLYLEAAKATCKLADKFWYNKFKKSLLDNFGEDHFRSKELLKFELSKKCSG